MSNPRSSSLFLISSTFAVLAASLWDTECVRCIATAVKLEAESPGCRVECYTELQLALECESFVFVHYISALQGRRSFKG